MQNLIFMQLTLYDNNNKQNHTKQAMSLTPESLKVLKGVSPYIAKSQFSITCPYNPLHKVAPAKFAHHLQKCRKKLTPIVLSRFSVCKFNSLHIFNKSEIEEHQARCPDKKQMQTLSKKLLAHHEESFSSKTNGESKKHRDCFNLSKQLRQQTIEVLGNKSKVKTEIIEPISRRIRRRKQKIVIDCDSIEIQRDKELSEKFRVQNSFVKGSCLFSTHKQGTQPSSIAQSKSESKKLPSQGNYGGLCFKIKSQTIFCQKSKSKSKSQESFVGQKEEPLMDLRKCSLCSSALCDPHVRAWTNKKLMKYLKAYRKLDEQHSQLKQFISNMKSHFMKQKQKSNKIKNDLNIDQNDQSDSGDQSDEIPNEMEIIQEQSLTKNKQKTRRYPSNGSQKNSLSKSNIRLSKIATIEMAVSNGQNNPQKQSLPTSWKEYPGQNICDLTIELPKFEELKKLMNSKMKYTKSYEVQTVQTLQLPQTSQDVYILD